MGVSHGIQPTWRHLAEPNTASETGNHTQHSHIKYYSSLIMGEPVGLVSATRGFRIRVILTGGGYFGCKIGMMQS